MPRTTNAPASRERRKRVIQKAKGYRGRRSKLFRYAKDATMKGQYWSYRDRKARKRTFRNLWVARLNAAVIGISIDTPFAQEAWAKQEKIGIPLASDLNKKVIKDYDVVFPNLAGIGDTAARAAFVIDKHGVVQYAEQTASPKELPNFDAVKQTLTKLG